MRMRVYRSIIAWVLGLRSATCSSLRKIRGKRGSGGAYQDAFSFAGTHSQEPRIILSALPPVHNDTPVICVCYRADRQAMGNAFYLLPNLHMRYLLILLLVTLSKKELYRQQVPFSEQMAASGGWWTTRPGRASSWMGPVVSTGPLVLPGRSNSRSLWCRARKCWIVFLRRSICGPLIIG